MSAPVRARRGTMTGSELAAPHRSVDRSRVRGELCAADVGVAVEEWA